MDAQRIRNKILSNFESALQPGLTDEERQRLLHIVIVGGGPTGVEFGAEVYDFVRADVARLYEKDAGLIQVRSITRSCGLPDGWTSRGPVVRSFGRMID